MLRRSRPLLLGLLCLLVLSWGTCPCVIANGLEGGHPDTKIEAGCCPHCQKRAPASSDDPGNRPGKCPSCGRGSPNRDLPPNAAGDVELASAPPAVVSCCLPVPVAPTPVDAAHPGSEATGPPTALAPHACPVGVVRLLN